MKGRYKLLFSLFIALCVYLSIYYLPLLLQIVYYAIFSWQFLATVMILAHDSAYPLIYSLKSETANENNRYIILFTKTSVIYWIGWVINKILKLADKYL